MATLRLIEPHEHPAPDKPPQTEQPGEEVPIRLESLPIPLRAVVRDQPDGSLRIEAELPWLAVATTVHTGSPEGGERTAQVQDFDMEVTRGGSARLVILTAPPAGAPAQPTAVARTRPQARRHLRSLVAGALIAIVAAASGYAVGRLTPAKLALEPPRPAPIASALPAPAPPPVAEAQLPAPPPPAPTLAEAPEPTPAAAPAHKTVRKAGKAKSSHKRHVSRRP